MAIKGKGKTRARRPATNAPRPVIVPPKVPLLRRRWFRVVALLVVLAGIGGGLLVAFRVRADDERERKLKDAVAQFDAGVRIPLQDISQDVPPARLLLFPDFVQDFGQFQEGKLKEPKMRRVAEQVKGDADRVRQSVQNVEIPEGMRNTKYATEMADGQLLMGQAFQAYGRVADLVLLSLDLDGKPRRTLLGQIAAQLTDAGFLFDAGYQKVINAKADFGLIQTSAPSVPFSPAP
jgi:hypothetical protein